MNDTHFLQIKRQIILADTATAYVLNFQQIMCLEYLVIFIIIVIIIIIIVVLLMMCAVSTHRCRRPIYIPR